MGAACHAKDPTKNKKELLDESDPVTRPKAKTEVNIQGGRLNPRPRLSYMHSIPITELSPHKLSQPPLEGLGNKLTNQTNVAKKKKKRKGGKKKKKAVIRKTLPPITLNAPCLQNLDQNPNENNNTHENGQNNDNSGNKTDKEKEESSGNQHQKPNFQQPFENKLPGDEEYLDLELNDIQEAHELNDLIEEEIKKITEQKENIEELGHHLKQENNILFEHSSKNPQKMDKNFKEDSQKEDDIFYSTLKTFNKMKSNINQKDEDYSVLNQVIHERMQELEKKKKDLNNFKLILKECIEKENKLEDDDFANTLDEEFSRVKAENEFLKAYKNIKNEEKEVSSPGLSKLKASIMKETYDLQETKNHLKKIRKKIEGKDESKITDEEIDKVKKGLKHELVGMISSIRNSNNLLDFNKM